MAWLRGETQARNPSGPIWEVKGRMTGKKFVGGFSDFVWVFPLLV